MPEHWSQEEVEATVSDYFEMLAMELFGESFNKAEHNRNLQNLLNNRTKGSIERKHQNISAVMIELGYAYIDGYKPLKNYQELLYNIVEERLPGAIKLRRAIEMAVERVVDPLPAPNNLLEILVNPPRQEADEHTFKERAPRIHRAIRRNYLEIESRNQNLGLAGEKLVLEFEHKRLWTAGKKDLADRIEHVAESSDDHGFDIKSYKTDGRDRLIEVKTTRFGSLTPFFASKNEVAVSDNRENEYQLYRLYHFTKNAKLFILPGSIRNSCSLDPIQYAAIPR